MARKKAEFIITKAQVSVMVSIYNGDKTITFYSHRANLELRFIDIESNTELNRNVILELVKKQLIRYDYKFLSYNLTKLGHKITKIKLEKAQNPAAIVVKPELMGGPTNAVEVRKALRNYNFLRV